MLTLEQEIFDGMYRTMREKFGMEPKGLYDDIQEKQPMNPKTYFVEQVAELLGITPHQVHYLANNGLIPKPLVKTQNACFWSAQQIDFYLEHGMQKFNEVYCA
jgi:hypothetical protein